MSPRICCEREPSCASLSLICAHHHALEKLPPPHLGQPLGTRCVSCVVITCIHSRLHLGPVCAVLGAIPSIAVCRSGGVSWGPCRVCVRWGPGAPCTCCLTAPLFCSADPRERHGPSTTGGQLPGARRGPGPRRPAPLPAQPPGALGCVLRPLRVRPACRPRRPCTAARCLPLRPHCPAHRHRCPGGPPLACGSPQQAPRPAPRR